MPAFPRFSRRKFMYLAGIAGASPALAACDRLIPTASNSSQAVQLVYQDWRTDWFPGMAQDLLGEFHETHPNIRVYYTPDPENLEDRMIVDMKAGTAADVFQGCCAHFPAWAQQGYALDLRPFVEADLDQETIKDWDSAQYHAFFTQDGRQYGLPKYHGSLALFYNKDYFDRYQVDYPTKSWTYDDYYRAMQLLTRDTDGDGVIDVWGSMVDVSWERLQVHVNGWGGHLVDPEDPTRSRMGDPEAVAAFEWLRKCIWDDNIMATIAKVQRLGTSQAFVAGKVAMIEDGSWALKDILSRAPFRIGVAPFPTGPAKKVTLATNDGFGIYSGTKHPEAAWELLKFLISKEYGRAMARANFLQPARASLLGDWITYIRDEYPKQTMDVDLEAFSDGHLRGYSVVPEVFANMSLAKPIAQDAWDRILTFGYSPVNALVEASQRIQQTQQ